MEISFEVNPLEPCNDRPEYLAAAKSFLVE